MVSATEKKVTQVIVKQEKWNDQAERLVEKLRPAMGRDILKKNIDDGYIAMYSVAANGAPVGLFFARVDRTYEGKEELVIMFSVAEIKTPMPFSHVICFAYEHIAGGRDIRIHSDNRVIDEFLEKNGYQFLEAIYIKKDPK